MHKQKKIKFRKIRKNHSEAVPTQMCFVDCETKDFNPEKNENHEIHKLWFGVATFGVWDKGRLTRRKEIVFTSVEEFWVWLDEVARPKSRLWIFAHNVGFDMTVLDLFGQIKNGRFSTIEPAEQQGIGEEGKPFNGALPGIIILEDPPTLISLTRRDGCRTMVLDTLNYWRTSLAVLGESVDLKKLEMPEYSESYETWVEYCRRDVEIIERAICKLVGWWKENKLGKFGFTSPSLAMSAFRHMNTKVDLHAHQEEPVRWLERDSYYGGQLEAYKIGHIKERVYQYDVASLYPSVMIDRPMPIQLRDYEITNEARNGFPPIDPLTSIAEVYICSDIDTFPVRTKQGVIYMNGAGWVTLAGPELLYAYKNKLIAYSKSWATYICKEVFGDFVRKFWAMKLEGEREKDTVKRTFAKLLLNSLYGKFGQLGADLVPVNNFLPAVEFGLTTMSKHPGGEVRRFLSFFDVCFEEVRGKELSRSMPAISSFVTSYARQRMRKIRKIAGVGNYFYQSTDSLMVNEAGKENLENQGEIESGVLGKLSIEAAGHSGWIGGLHFYRIGDKFTEGAKKRSAETIDKFHWREPHFDSLKSVIERGGSPEIHIKKIIKSRELAYTKGCVGSDGWVSPYCLESIDKIQAYSTVHLVS